MMQNLFSYLSMLLLATLVACGPAPEADSQAENVPIQTDYHSRSCLLEVEELVEMQAKGQAFGLIEVNLLEEYQKGHIEGAVQVWRPDYENRKDYEYGGMMASPAHMESLLSRMGIHPDQLVVLYDSKGNVDAARLFWIMKQYGHTKLALLNGGKAAWKLSDQKLSVFHTPILASNYHFPAQAASMPNYISADQIQQQLGTENFRLLDTRNEAEYRGETQKNGAAKAGRIPGAVHLDWAYAVNYGEDFRFKSYAELKALYEEKGVLPGQQVVVYCHSGVRSAHTAFVLTELLGYPTVNNYDGSWTEWSHLDLPFEQDELQEQSHIEAM